MSRLQFYFNNHLKSLYISKFLNNKFINQKFGFKNISIKIKFLKKEYFLLDLKWIFFFFLTGQWPLIKIKFYFLKGKKTLNLKSFETILRKHKIFIFIDKLILISLINLENWLGINSIFKLISYNKKTLNQLNFFLNNLTIFWELEFLSRNPLNIIKKEIKNCLFIVKFLFNKKNLNKNLTILRSLSFPAYFSN